MRWTRLAASVGLHWQQWTPLVHQLRARVAFEGVLDDEFLRLDVEWLGGSEVLEVPRKGAHLALSGDVLWVTVPGRAPERVTVAGRARSLVLRLLREAAPSGGAPALKVDVESHDRVRLRLEPVFAPFPSAALAVFSLVALFALGAVAVGAASSAPGSEVVVVFGGIVAVPAVALAASSVDAVRRVVRVELWVAGEQLVLRTATQLRTRERRVPLVDLRGVELLGHAVELDVGGERVIVPIPDRTPKTRAELVAFLRAQIARAAHRRGEVPADMLRLRDAGDR